MNFEVEKCRTLIFEKHVKLLDSFYSWDNVSKVNKKISTFSGANQNWVLHVIQSSILKQTVGIFILRKTRNLTQKLNSQKLSKVLSKIQAWTFSAFWTMPIFKLEFSQFFDLSEFFSTKSCKILVNSRAVVIPLERTQAPYCWVLRGEWWIKIRSIFTIGL